MLIDAIMQEHSDMQRPDAIFNIQNVADYFYAFPNCVEGNYIQACFSYRLPFHLVWFEYRLSHLKCGAFAWIEEEDSFGHAFHLLSFFGHPTRPLYGCFGGIFLPVDKNYRAISGDTVFCFRRPDDFVHRLGIRFYGADSKDISDDFMPDKKISAANLALITTALNFLHCKNVAIAENHIPKKLIRANIRRGKERPYFEKFYTLAIEPMKRVLNTEGQAQSVGIKKAFHICRGHFKTYDENPLFGKLRGTFWTPAHVKGSIGRGIIKKDYEIKI